MNNFNYEELLENWAESCYKEMDKCNEILKNESNITMIRESYIKGCQNGIAMSMTFLSREEKKLKNVIEK